MLNRNARVTINTSPTNQKTSTFVNVNVVVVSKKKLHQTLMMTTIGKHIHIEYSPVAMFHVVIYIELATSTASKNLDSVEMIQNSMIIFVQTTFSFAERVIYSLQRRRTTHCQTMDVQCYMHCRVPVHLFRPTTLYCTYSTRCPLYLFKHFFSWHVRS